jgi:light-harvesting complex 1 beta chain
LTLAKRRTGPAAHRTPRHVAQVAHVARVVRGQGRKADLEGVVHMAERNGSVSGLTDDEAQEFHQYWMQGFVGFTAVAVVAHILVWIWRPWL